MSWLTLELAAKIFVPLGTFFLGIAITLIVKRIELRRSSDRDHLEALATLANDWYNQIHELNVDTTYVHDELSKRKAIYFYVHNRLILPKFLLHIEYLRQSKRFTNIVMEAELFLNVITTRPQGRTAVCKTFQGAITNAKRTRRSFSDHFFDMQDTEIDKSKRPKRPGRKNEVVHDLTELVAELDVRLQNLTRLAGRSLAK